MAPLPEQTAIAEILSDMDAEIEALENKLAKARQIKQGMMQELLTGRIRLIAREKMATQPVAVDA
jgi:type I restriction enzyme S subunit